MTPLNVDTVQKQKCLSDYVSKSNWTLNFNYWTGGTQQGCRGSWRWCGGGTGVFDDLVQWEPGQPDNKGGRQDCVHLRLNNSNFLLTDRNCTDKYILACQVLKTKISFPFLKKNKLYKKGAASPDKPPVEIPDCPFTECRKNV